ncbi:MAG: YraN family protein [Aaplasma endosymbiont of Hyalomma asiaticum]
MVGYLNNVVGYWGELFVLLLLKIRLHKVLHHRYKIHNAGEIDIISQKGDSLFFIEVKTSIVKSSSLIPLSLRQRRSITRMTKYFLCYNPQFSGFQINFEVYFISLRDGITKIKNAWYDD